ncbi:hypothetical protein [Actinomadura violacea]|uniref:Uncharacterized protein n=1 Tax=Actinomadura violacea TaxID=2819934 RepID=A0ABS3S661_9ACTN|nr:hypothetical protein [Actinomadura violacea]MBO2464494.1 hypothetical protein [Actinomadura violacea]
MRRGQIAAILSPAAGNQLPDGCLFAADNAVYGGSYPGDQAYRRWLGSLAPHADRALWVTAPDVVGDHLATLARSRPWLEEIRAMGFPAALCAQNGMEWDHSSDLWEMFDVLFLAGTTQWKMSTAAAELVRVALDHGKPVHVGRVNSRRRLRYSQYLGASSADGTYLTYGPDLLLPRVLEWTRELATHPALFDYEQPDDEAELWSKARRRS